MSGQGTTPVLRYDSPRECPDAATHTESPTSYVAWHEWAETKSKTHTNHRCPTCGYWMIWKPKAKRG